MKEDEDRKQVALEYVKQALPVYAKGVSRPADATTCVDTIDEWWIERPDATPMLPLGEKWVVVRTDGEARWVALWERHERPPETPVFSVPRGTGLDGGYAYRSSYYLFRAPEDAVYTCRERFGSEQVPGVSVLADGGFPLPTRERKQKGFLFSLRNLEPAVLPEWLADMTRRGRGGLRSFGDLLAGDSTTPYVVDGLIQDAGLNTIFAPTDSFKSFIALDMSLHVASGREWSGRQVEPGSVVYVAAEDARGYEGRIKAWATDHLPDGGGGLRHGFMLQDAPVNLLSGEDVGAFIDEVREGLSTSPRLVVLDPLVECMPGGNESVSSDMSAAVSSLRRIQRELDAAVLVIHHTGVSNTKRERGHSALPGAMDERWRVEASKGRRPYAELVHVRSRNRATEPEPIALDFRPVADSLVVDHGGDGLAWWAEEVRTAVLDYHAEHGSWPSRSKVYTDLLDGRTADAKDALARLVDDDASDLAAVPNPSGRGEVVQVTDKGQT